MLQALNVSFTHNDRGTHLLSVQSIKHTLRALLTVMTIGPSTVPPSDGPRPTVGPSPTIVPGTESPSMPASPSTVLPTSLASAPGKIPCHGRNRAYRWRKSVVYATRRGVSALHRALTHGNTFHRRLYKRSCKYHSYRMPFQCATKSRLGLLLPNREGMETSNLWPRQAIHLNPEGMFSSTKINFLVWPTFRHVIR